MNRWDEKFLAADALAADDRPHLLQTPQGALLGVTRRHGDRRIGVFKAIPYAAPPTGTARWRPPTPVAPWSGVRAALHYPPDCIQPPAMMPADALWYQGPLLPESEDCLYLNVWTPAGEGAGDAGRRPVIVWIHGGSFVSGSGSHHLYDGCALAAKDVVVVTVNYRLGILGLFAHPELTAESPHGSSGNYAVADVIQALRWIRENIASFGGDPGCVTLAGESSGAFLVSLIMGSPHSKGLIHRAIGQSGGMFYRTRRLRGTAGGRPGAEEMGAAFASALGAHSVADLRAIPARDLVNKAFEHIAHLDGAGFLMAVDGWIVPDFNPDIFDRGEQADIPVLAGFNSDECNSMASFGAVPPIAPDAAAYRAQLATTYGDLAGRVAAVYPDSDPLRSTLKAFDYALFGYAAEQWCHSMRHVSSQAYLYHFAHRAPGAQTRLPAPPDREADLGAFHSAEIGYAFGHIDDGACYAPNIPFGPIGEKERAMSELMSDYWTSFARDGVPSSRRGPEWKSYSEAGRDYMQFGDGRATASTHLMPGARELQQSIANAAWEREIGWTGGNPDLV